MSYYIIIRGPAGVGKTIIGEKLAEKLNGQLISFDMVLDENGLGYVPGEECVPGENFFKANKIVFSLADNELKKGEIVVIEGNFYHISPLEDLIDQLDYPHFVFTLKASVNECVERDKTRKGIGEKRIKDVYNLVSRFDYGQIVDTNNKVPEEIIQEIILYLSNSSFN